MVARYRLLPFGAWLDGWAEALLALGYRGWTIRQRLARLGHFGDYLQARGLAADALAQEAVLNSFMSTWERGFRDQYGRPPQRATWLAMRCAVRSLAAYARQVGHLPPLEQASTAPPLLEEYLDFCRTHRGLSASSCRAHRHYLLRLAAFCRGQGVENLSLIPLPILDGFIGDQGRALKRESLHGVVGIVRAFLHYLFLVGLEVRDRSRLLEYPSTFRQMRLPRHLSDAQLAEVLGRVDRSTLRGKRDWAVLMVLTTYGLRGGEVARLQLRDVERNTRQLRVHRLKGGGVQMLPLTAAVTEALDDYLQVRPPSEHPEIFLMLRTPVRPYTDGSALALACVRRYMPRSDALPARGGHALRHTVARRLRQSGAGLGVVRRILGHRSAETTNRYLRISLEELREVADNYAELL